MIIATPNHLAAARSDALVELLDLYPTLADLAGLTAPGNLEGVSLRPVLEDPDATVKSAAFTWHPRPAYPPAGSHPKAMGYSMRTDRYRYTEWRDFNSGRVIARELYDHSTDSRETVNLAGQAATAKTVEQLGAKLEQMLKRRGVWI